jgi:thiol-disulfide isomerase/thioredoxin
MRAKIIVGLAVGAYALVVLAAVFAFVFLKPASVHEVRFSSLTGGTFSTAELRGKVVLVNFWATYCGSCIAEMPKFVETHKKFAARGYDTIAVAVRQDSPQRVAEFAASHDLPFRIALDSSGAAALHRRAQLDRVPPAGGKGARFLDPCFVGLLVRVVRGANHRADRGMAEAHLPGLPLVVPEYLRIDVAHHR